MRAWDELAKSRSLYWTSESDWYIDHGVKIERFHEDGRIEIKNVMTTKEKFEDVSSEVFSLFDKEGWMAGCMHLNIEVYQSKLFNINNLIRVYLNSRNERMVDALRDRREIIQKKINKCRDRLTNN